MNDSEADFASIVEQIQRGDRRAEEELVNRVGRGVRLMLRKRLASQAAVDDLYQETFRIVLLKVRDKEIRSPDKLPSFVASVARNLAMEYTRREGRRQSRPLDEIHPSTPSSSNPDDLLEAREKAALVRQVLQEMGIERDREILLRFYLAGEDKASICADLNLSPLHFNRVLYRARQRYRTLYESTLRRKSIFWKKTRDKPATGDT